MLWPCRSDRSSCWTAPLSRPGSWLMLAELFLGFSICSLPRWLPKVTRSAACGFLTNRLLFRWWNSKTPKMWPVLKTAVLDFIRTALHSSFLTGSLCVHIVVQKGSAVCINACKVRYVSPEHAIKPAWKQNREELKSSNKGQIKEQNSDQSWQVEACRQNWGIREQTAGS